LGPEEDNWDVPAVWTPPPPVTVEQSWATPGPVVQRIPEEGPGLFDKIFSVFDRGVTSVNRVVDIFGRQVASPPPVAPVAAPTPIWVYLAIPVALVGVIALMRRKPSGGLGSYKRRRRSRR
jgi:hypothetical protein